MKNLSKKKMTKVVKYIGSVVYTGKKYETTLNENKINKGC